MRTRGRLEFKNETKRAAFDRSGGICECRRIPHVFSTPCGQKLTDGRIRYEHIICDAMDPDNSLDNCAVLTVACWRYKTDKYDLPTIAKSNRQRDDARGIKNDRRRKMQFGKDSRLKRKVNGQVVDRLTGRPLYRNGRQAYRVEE